MKENNIMHQIDVRDLLIAYDALSKDFDRKDMRVKLAIETLEDHICRWVEGLRKMHCTIEKNENE